MDAEALGEVLGEVLGLETLGARHRRGRHGHHGHHGHHSMPVMHKPPWRHGQLAPGVQSPREGYVPLPLNPQTNNGLFTSTVTNIQFLGKVQKPYQACRLLVQVIRTGTTAAAAAPVASIIAVGTDIQQAQLGNIPLEFFTATAFDVVMNLTPAEPGIDITFNTNLTAGLTSPDTLLLIMTLLGNIIE